jgi:hypothetical protein
MPWVFCLPCIWAWVDRADASHPTSENLGQQSHTSTDPSKTSWRQPLWPSFGMHGPKKQVSTTILSEEGRREKRTRAAAEE